MKDVSDSHIGAKLSKGFLFIGGCAVYALSVNMFTAPNDIAPGGLTGIATMLNYMLGLPIGTVIAVMNVPLLIAAYFSSGAKLIFRSVLGIAVTSLMIDISEMFLPVFRGELFLVTFIGGALSGLGLALIYSTGATTGGADLAANMLKQKYPFISLGRLILIIDAAVVMLSSLVYRNFESPLCAAVTIFVSSKVIDTVLYGLNTGSGKIMFIISAENNIIKSRILSELERGVTEFPAKGAYSGQACTVLMCAVRRHEVYRIYNIIRFADKHAFVIVGDAGEIKGEGFLMS